MKNTTTCPKCYSIFAVCSKCGYPKLDDQNKTIGNAPHKYCPMCGEAYSTELPKAGIKSQKVKKIDINKHDLKWAMKRSVSPERLQVPDDIGSKERLAVDWLLSNVDKRNLVRINQEPEISRIKRLILQMDKSEPSYQNSSAESKALVEQLLEHDEIVNVVLLNVFQWFGTNVGRYEVGKLLDELRGIK